MTTNAFVGVDLWIDEDELEELALGFERIVTRSRQRPAPERPAFYVDYIEAE